MTRPAPRTLTEKEQRTELAGGNRRLAARLNQIDGIIERLTTTVAEIRGRSNRQADRLNSSGGQSEIVVQTSSEWQSSQTDAYDWIESAPEILERHNAELRRELLG